MKEHLIEFNQLAMANHDGSEDMLNRVMTKDNIGLAALLHTNEEVWGGEHHYIFRNHALVSTNNPSFQCNNYPFLHLVIVAVLLC